MVSSIGEVENRAAIWVKYGSDGPLSLVLGVGIYKIPLGVFLDAVSAEVRKNRSHRINGRENVLLG